MGYGVKTNQLLTPQSCITINLPDCTLFKNFQTYGTVLIQDTLSEANWYKYSVEVPRENRITTCEIISILHTQHWDSKRELCFMPRQ